MSLLPSHYVYDIRNASKEDIQKVATILSKSVNNNYKYSVKNEDLKYDAMHAYHPDYVGLNGVGFSGLHFIENNDEMTKSAFKSLYKVELIGVLTVEEAIKKFNL